MTFFNNLYNSITMFIINNKKNLWGGYLLFNLCFYMFISNSKYRIFGLTMYSMSLVIWCISNNYMFLLFSYNKWKMKNLFGIIDKHINNIKENCIKRTELKINNNKIKNILTEKVKEGGVSDIIMSYMEVECNFEKEYDIITDYGDLFESNELVKTYLIRKYINDSLKELLEWKLNYYRGLTNDRILNMLN